MTIRDPILDNFPTWRRITSNGKQEQNIVNRKNVLKTTDTPLGGSIILCTLVH